MNVTKDKENIIWKIIMTIKENIKLKMMSKKRKYSFANYQRGNLKFFNAYFLNHLYIHCSIVLFLYKKK